MLANRGAALKKGNASWLTATVVGQPGVDLRSNIAAEARAKITYERLMNFCNDADTKDALQLLMSREITHMNAFELALGSLGKGRLEVGLLPPTPGLVDQYFNDSTGEDDDGEKDMLGPWNDGGSWERVDAPAFQALADINAGTRDRKAIGKGPSEESALHQK